MLNKKRRLITLSLVLAVVTVMLYGCGGGLMTALRIVGVSTLLPDKWSSKSRVVTLIADVLSGRSLEHVIAYITHSGDPRVIAVVLTRNAEGKYQGDFEVPAGETQPETYTAVVTATDQTGNQTTSAPVAIEVPPTTDATPAAQ